MKERPILFNAEMVNAILDGRKTQTRRPIKPQPVGPVYGPSFNGGTDLVIHGDGWATRSTFGAAGDQLWVRETFRVCLSKCADTGVFPMVAYRADGAWNCGCDASSHTFAKWTPSIHMKREHSRIDLIVKRVWVERVQEISVEDCHKEGCTYFPYGSGKNLVSFRSLWESIYSKDDLSWEANPWVWCCEFEEPKAEGGAE